MFFWDRGFLDGPHGLVLSLFTACYAISKDTHVWEASLKRRAAGL
jgi:hypothetical protein